MYQLLLATHAERRRLSRARFRHLNLVSEIEVFVQVFKLFILLAGDDFLVISTLVLGAVVPGEKYAV